MLNAKNGFVDSLTGTDLGVLVGILVASVVFWTVICGCMCWSGFSFHRFADLVRFPKNPVF